MAKGKKTGGKDFKPGHGIGRPRVPDEIKKAIGLTKAEAATKLVELMKLNLTELETLIRDRSKSALELWIARIIALGIKTGDHSRLNFMFDRIIGKVTDKVEISAPKPTILRRFEGDEVIILSSTQDKETN